MSKPDPQTDHPSHQKGATTAGKGTPVGVTVSAPRGAATMMLVFLAGPLLWSLHFLLVYLVVEAGCTADGPGLDVFDPPVPTIVTLAGTALAALGCLAAAFWGYRRWRAATRQGTDAPSDQFVEPGGALAFAGFLLSLLGFVSVLFVGLPALVLPACLP